MLRCTLLVALAAYVAQARVIAVRVQVCMQLALCSYSLVGMYTLQLATSHTVLQDGAVTSSEPSYAAFSSVQPWLASTTPFMQDANSDEELPEPIQAQLAW